MDSQAAESETERFSPFLSLPPELRMMIYEYAFHDNTAIIDVHAVKEYGTSIVGHIPPGILLANKLTYAEATLTFYRSTTFTIIHYGTDWIKGLPKEHLDEIKAIYFSGGVCRIAWKTIKFLAAVRRGLERDGVDLKAGVLKRLGWVSDGEHACFEG